MHVSCSVALRAEKYEVIRDVLLPLTNRIFSWADEVVGSHVEDGANALSC